MEFKIENIKARQVLDSRGNPTVQAEVRGGGQYGIASVPSGASTGKYEAHELRDGIAESYGGNGVAKAVNFINTEIRDMLMFRDLTDQRALDVLLIDADGTPNKARFGANATLAVSLATAKCAAKAVRSPLYRYIGGFSCASMPIPMLNVINGGKHADNGLDIQEFMLIPKKDEFPRMLERSVKVYKTLKGILKERGLNTALGDEGGFAPQLESHEQALELLLNAIERSGFIPGEDFSIGLDIASSEFKCEDEEVYRMEKSGKCYSRKELSDYYDYLLSAYPILSIEDPFSDDDWDGWSGFTSAHPNNIIVGDDLFVTNKSRLETGIVANAGNAVLIKPNQIGTLSETLDCIFTARKAGYKVILSHRSGETEDTSIADIAVAVGADLIKSGAPARSERTAKYNRLLKIYEEIAHSL